MKFSNFLTPIFVLAFVIWSTSSYAMQAPIRRKRHLEEVKPTQRQLTPWEHDISSQFSQILTQQPDATFSRETQRQIYKKIIGKNNQKIRESLSLIVSEAIKNSLKSGKLPQRVKKYSEVVLKYNYRPNFIPSRSIKDGDTVFFGRLKNVCDIAIKTPNQEKDPAAYLEAMAVSRVHIAIIRSNGYILIIDLGSLAGTRVIKLDEDGNREQEELIDSKEKVTPGLVILAEDQRAIIKCAGSELLLSPKGIIRARHAKRAKLLLEPVLPCSGKNNAGI